MYRRISSYFLIVILVVASLSGCVNTSYDKVDEPSSQSLASSSLIDISLINEERAFETILELTKEKYNGRLAGTQENLEAANYIAKEFEKIGLEYPETLDGYFQFYTQKNIIMQSGSKFEFMTLSGEVEEALMPHNEVRDMVRFPGTMASGERIGEMVHVTDLDQFKENADVLGGKILLINHEIYDPNNPGRLLNKAMALTPKPAGIFIHRDNRYNEYFLVSKYIPENMKSASFDDENGPGVFYLTADGFTKCIEALRDGKLMKYSTDYSYDDYQAPNVIGVIPSTQEKVKGTLMFTAHFDHVGTNGDGSFNPGALDNASGVSAVIELARIIKESAIDSPYNYVFAGFNGEEESLYGATYYVNNPLYDLENTSLVNFDMVGSARELALNINVNNFAMGDTQEELHDMAKELKIPSHKAFGGASDNVPFEVNGVDAVLLIHLDMTDIHTRRDTVDNVDSSRLKEVVVLVASWLNAYKTE